MRPVPLGRRTSVRQVAEAGLRILWVENHSRFVSVVRQRFLAGHDLTVVPSLEAARAAAGAGAGAFDAALVDFDLDDGKGTNWSASCGRVSPASRSSPPPPTRTATVR